MSKNTEPFAGFEPPTYTQIPNNFFTELLPKIDTLAEMKTTLIAMFRTFGFHRERAQLSERYLVRATGLKHRGSARVGLNMACQRKTLRRIEKATKSEAAIYEVVIADKSQAVVLEKGRNPKPKQMKLAALLEGEKSPHQEMILTLAFVMGVDANLNAGKIVRTASDLRKAGYTALQVLSCYGEGGWWYKEDWRGKKGEHPTLSAIRETIQEASKNGGEGAGAWEKIPNYAVAR